MLQKAPPAPRSHPQGAHQRRRRTGSADRRHERICALHRPSSCHVVVKPRGAYCRGAWISLASGLLAARDRLPSVQVSTQLPGAGPDTMASLVTTPLEQQLGQIAGLSLMTSTSSFGISVITMQFVLDRDIDAIGQDVQAAINAAGASLPSGLPYPPVYNKVNPPHQPILILALTSDTQPITKVQDIADTVLAQKLSEVTGVGAVMIQGGQKPAVRIQVNPVQLAAYDLSLEQVRTVLGRTNVDQPKGSFEDRKSTRLNSSHTVISYAVF